MMTPIGLFGVVLAVISVVAAYWMGHSHGFAAGRQAGHDQGKREGAREGSIRAYAVGFDRGKRANEPSEEAPPHRPNYPRWGYLAAALAGLLILYAVARAPQDGAAPSSDSTPPLVESEELSLDAPGE